MLGVWTLMPIMFPKIKPYLHIAVDFLAIAGFLAVIAFQLGDWKWCTHIAIPITAATGVLACVVALIVRAKVLTPMTKASVVCASLGLYILALEVIIDFSQGWFSQISWSIYAIVPLLFLSLLLFYVSRKPGLMDELKRRLFV